MYLHIAEDEKFIDHARSAFEKAAPGRNAFLVPGSAPLQHIRTFQPIRATWPTLIDRSQLELLPGYRVVFLHSLSSMARSLVYRAPSGVNFAWLGWGYDYYHLIAARNELLLPLTAGLVDSISAGSPSHRPPIATLAGLLRYVRQTPSRLAFHRERRLLQADGPKERCVLDKIRWFAPVLPSEYDKVLARHPQFSPSFASWNYRIDLSASSEMLRRGDGAGCVLVGNSASPESNHLDSFEWIVANRLSGDVVCPLSYGDPNYRDAVIEAGNRLFGPRFIPILEFMPERQYASLIASASLLIMNHRRQQGLGNILLALQAGVRVLLREDNPIQPFLASLGIRTTTFSEFERDNERALPGDVIEGNRAAIDVHFGASRHHQRTVDLLRHCDDPTPRRSVEIAKGRPA